MPDKVKQSALIAEASRKGIAFVPGAVFYSSGIPEKNYIRLNFTFSKHEQIVEGTKRLMTCYYCNLCGIG